MSHRGCGVAMATALFCMSAGMASAKTIRVEPWGEFGPVCGTKTSPCVNIAAALLAANAKNDRIIVGPGRYVGNYTITVEGLRLESAEGPHATILQSANTAVNVLSISQRNVRVGRRGKGFTIVNASSPVASGVRVTSPVYDGTRVEGNVFDGNHIGIWLAGSKPVARYNLVLDSSSIAIYLQDAESGMVSDNRVFQTEGHGIRLFDSNKISVQNNLVHGATSGVATNLESGDARIKSNALIGGQGTGNAGLAINNAEGLELDGNVVSRGSWGLYLANQAIQLDPAVIRNNAAVGQSGTGFFLGNYSNAGPTFDLRFDNNTGISANNSGVDLIYQARISSAQGNNLHANTQHGFDNNTGVPVLLKKSYYGLINGIQGLGYSGTDGSINPSSTESAKPNGFKARKAAKLM